MISSVSHDADTDTAAAPDPAQSGVDGHPFGRSGSGDHSHSGGHLQWCNGRLKDTGAVYFGTFLENLDEGHVQVY